MISIPANQPSASYDYNDSNDSLPLSPTPSGSAVAVKLARERNRLTLRSYIHFLMSSPTVASSPVMQSFLTASSITLTPAEEEDARRREEGDRVREDGRRRFAEEIAIRVETLRGALRHVKGEMMAQSLSLLCVTIDISEHYCKMGSRTCSPLSKLTPAFMTYLLSTAQSWNGAELRKLSLTLKYHPADWL